jgi:hypothetical protein
MSRGENKLGMKDFPIEIEYMIMQYLYNKAIEDQQRYENFFQDNEHIHIVMDDEDEINTPHQQLVPYWKKDNTKDMKSLDKIDTINDGIPINELYRMPWEHPELHMGKADTFLHFSEQANQNRTDRDSQESNMMRMNAIRDPHMEQQARKIYDLLYMLQGVGTNNRGGGMKNQEVKKCEKKKVVLGKERCIYKVSGSKKDYMKYKGKLVPVTDYVKYMKKKN